MCTSAGHVPLQECERLDQSLALALRHLTWPRPRPAPGVRPESTGTTTATELTDRPSQAHLDQPLAANANTPVDAETLVDAMDSATDPEDHIGDYYYYY